MTTRRNIVLVGLVGFGILGSVFTSQAAQAQGRDQRLPWNLAEVAATCQRTATDERPGVVEISSRLVDANRNVTIGVPCVVHLVDGAGVSLTGVRVTSRTLNIHDRSTGARPTAVSVSNSTFTATDAASGFLVELNDAADTVSIASTTITAPRGVVVRAAGTRDGNNAGGTVSMARSTVVSDGTGTSGIFVAASDTTGRLNLAETVLDTPGNLTVLAGRCSATLQGRVLNCSADQVARELQN